MSYEVQFQHEGSEYTVRGPDIDGVLRLIQGVQTVPPENNYERCRDSAVSTLRRLGYKWRGGDLWVPPLSVPVDTHAELRKTWAPGQKWQTRMSAGGEWYFISGAPGWHANQEYRQCE